MDPTTPKPGKEVLYLALAEYVRNQASERRLRGIRWIVVITLMVVYMAINVVYMLNNDDHFLASKHYAAVVHIDGIIGTGRVASTSILTPLLEQAFGDSKAACVALDINSPGGMVGQSQLIHDTIRKLAARTHKKVIAVGEDMMASGAYMIASAADEIYAPTTGIVGSIGVIQSGYDLTGLAEKQGIRDRTFTAGSMKDPFNPLAKMTPAAQAKADQVLDVLHGEFIRMVKQSRGDKLKGPDAELFNGQYWTGLTGEKLGLIDGHLDLQDAIKQDCGADTMVSYDPHLGVSDLMSFITNR